MAKYESSSESSIDSYYIGKESIQIRFNDGRTYLYTYESAGESNVEQMKELAKNGEGLNGFIKSNVNKNYASRKIT